MNYLSFCALPVSLLKNWSYFKPGDPDVVSLLLTQVLPNFVSSKALLLAFVGSKRVTDLVGADMSGRLTKFLNESVFVVENYFGRHRYIHVRAFRAWTNTKHEGTNNAIKYSENNVRPDMGLAESTKTLLTQDEERWKRKAKDVSNSLMKQRLRRNSSTADHLLKEVEGDVQKEFDSRHHYASFRSSPNEWLVLFMNKRVCNRAYPNYERVREVKLETSGRLYCSCGLPEEFGYPCRHIAHVLEYYAEGFDCFSPEDVDIRFHCLYAYYVAYKPKSELTSDEVTLRGKLMSLREAEPIQLPVLRHLLDPLKTSATGKDVSFAGCVIEHIQNVQKCQPLCSNYTKEQMEKALDILSKQSLGTGYREVRHNTEADSLLDDFDWPTTDTDDWAECGGNDSQATPEKAMYEMGQPIVKEIFEVYDGASPETKQRVCGELQRILADGKKKRALDLGGTEPCGYRVSGKVPSKRAPTQHKKQRR